MKRKSLAPALSLVLAVVALLKPAGIALRAGVRRDGIEDQEDAIADHAHHCFAGLRIRSGLDRQRDVPQNTLGDLNT